MPVSPSDIKWMLSVGSAAAGSTSEQTDKNLSLGGWMSTTPVPDSDLNNLFGNISGLQNQAGYTDYRCIFVYNSSLSDSIALGEITVSYDQPGGCEVGVGIDPIGPVPFDSTSQQAEAVSSGTEAPSGVLLVLSPTVLVVPTLGPGECLGIWVGRSAGSSSPASPERCVISLSWDDGT